MDGLNREQLLWQDAGTRLIETPIASRLGARRRGSVRGRTPMKAILYAVALSCAGISLLSGQTRTLPLLTRVAEGVFVYEHSDPTKQGVTANNLVVVTDDGVLVADGQGTVGNTRRLVADIATVTSQPVKYVVVGSEHGDHRGGDAGFPDGAVFIAHPFSQANLDRQSRAPGRRPDAPRTIVPTDTVSETRVLMLGGREIRIMFLGRAHTGGDLEVYLPREKVLFMSEAFLDGIFPSMANGYPTEWVATLQQAEQLDADVWVPAHGLADRSLSLKKDVEISYRHALERVIAEGRRLHAAKVSSDEASAKADFGEFAAWPRAADNAAGALKRVYMELDGELATAGSSASPR
jgi:glyoxylase-like metal-dependent hydrolase (beta-lactamase superfamily II)